MLRSLFLAALSLFCVSCASHSLQRSENSPDIEAMTLYLSRSQLINDPEFEQYTYQAGRIYRECGFIRRGRHKAEHQAFLQLSEEELNSIQFLSYKFIEESGDTSFDEPGDNRGLADPGIIEIALEQDGERADVKTSLDSISEPNRRAERHLLRLVEQVRGLGEVICNNTTFFGIRRAS